MKTWKFKKHKKQKSEMIYAIKSARNKQQKMFFGLFIPQPSLSLRTIASKFL